MNDRNNITEARELLNILKFDERIEQKALSIREEIFRKYKSNKHSILVGVHIRRGKQL